MCGLDCVTCAELFTRNFGGGVWCRGSRASSGDVFYVALTVLYMDLTVLYVALTVLCVALTVLHVPSCLPGTSEAELGVVVVEQARAMPHLVQVVRGVGVCYGRGTPVLALQQGDCTYSICVCSTPVYAVHTGTPTPGLGSGC